MADPLLAFLIKLPLALAVFLLIAYAGTVSKRIAGVLLTFPILNGIAIIASAAADRRRGCDLSAGDLQLRAVRAADLVSERAAAGRRAAALTPRLFARVIVWSLAVVRRCVSASRDFRAAISGAGVLLAAGAAIRDPVHACLLDEDSPARSGEPARHRDRCAHRARFIAFWATRTGAVAHRLLRSRLCVPVLGLARRARREMGRHGERAAAAGILRARDADRRRRSSIAHRTRDAAADPRHAVPRARAGDPVQLDVLAPARHVRFARTRSSRATCLLFACGPPRLPRWCCWFRASRRISTGGRS